MRKKEGKKMRKEGRRMIEGRKKRKKGGKKMIEGGQRKIKKIAVQKREISTNCSFFKLLGIELIPTISHIVRVIIKKLMHFIVNKGLDKGNNLSCLFGNFNLFF